MQLKDNISKKLEEANCLVEAYRTYYNLSDIAGGYTAGAAWTDADGVTHELSSGKNLKVEMDKQVSYMSLIGKHHISFQEKSLSDRHSAW